MKARNLFTFLLIFIFSGTAFGATITWIGGNGDWDIASNWDHGHVPAYDDEVIINSGEVRLEVIGEASRIQLNAGQFRVEGSLIVKPDVDGADAAFHIANEARFNNEGNVIFLGEPVSSSTHYSSFIFNYGVFQNEENGFIYMTGNHFDGIYNFESENASFTNYGRIQTEDTYRGIKSYSEFYNYGTIDISGVFTSLYTNNLLYNGSSAIFNANHRVLCGTSGHINNYGEINVETSVQNTIAVELVGRLDIQQGGSVNISGAYSTGLRVHMPDSELYNQGNIEIALDETNSIGILNGGILVNSYAGSITCASYYDQGPISDGLCNNFGIWHLKNEGEGPNGAVKIEGSFTNENSGKLYVEGKLTLPTGSGITNEGHMFVTSNISQSLIQGRITNIGMLNDVYGKLPNIDNLSIVARPVFYSSRIKNALALSSQPEGSIIGWYTTENGTVSAGSYDSNTNVFSPTKYAMKLNSIYVLIMHKSNNSLQRYEVKNIKSIAADHITTTREIRMRDNSLGQYEITVYPNPVSEVLNIMSRKFASNESFEARLTNVQGLTIARKTCENNCQLKIPENLVNGNYFLSIEKNGMLIQSPEQIRVLR